MHPDTARFNGIQVAKDRKICDLLAQEIDRGLPEAENRIWHAHPVWFLDANPVVGYSRLKSGIRLFFWSGLGFDEDALHPGTGKFKDAWIVYRNVVEVDSVAVRRWLDKARRIQWNYRDLRKLGRLVRIGPQATKASIRRQRWSGERRECPWAPGTEGDKVDLSRWQRSAQGGSPLL